MFLEQTASPLKANGAETRIRGLLRSPEIKGDPTSIAPGTAASFRTLLAPCSLGFHEADWGLIGSFWEELLSWRVSQRSRESHLSKATFGDRIGGRTFRPGQARLSEPPRFRPSREVVLRWC